MPTPGHGIGERSLKLVPKGKEFPNLCLRDARNDPQHWAGVERGAGGIC